MTSLEAERGGEASPKDTSPPVVYDSGVSNGSSSCLSDSGGPTGTETSKPHLIMTSAAPDNPSKVSSFLSVEEHAEKGLSCLSLEVCASGDNLNMLSQDDLSGCESAPGSLGSVERELDVTEHGSGEREDDQEEAEDRIEEGRVVLRVSLSGEHEDVGSRQDSQRNCGVDSREGTEGRVYNQ